MSRAWGALLLVVQTAAMATGPSAASTERLVDPRALKSRAALVVDLDSGEILASKNADAVVPVASLTKLMTALVVLDAKRPFDETIEITPDDVDRDKRTPSRLKTGTRLTRDELLLLALMASENRASMALSRHHPGGRLGFLEDMNAKARALGMRHTWFADPAGLSSQSVSTAHDLHLLLAAADREPLIRDYSTRLEHRVRVGRHTVTFINSNRLVRGNRSWDIGLQKTGFTNEAGRCLMMQVTLAQRRLGMIFLDSFGKLTRYGDASRVRRQLERITAPARARLAPSPLEVRRSGGGGDPGSISNP